MTEVIEWAEDLTKDNMQEELQRFRCMTNKQLIDEMKIHRDAEGCLCMGDVWHNEKIDLLFNGLDDSNKTVKAIAATILWWQKAHYYYRDKDIYDKDGVTDFNHTSLKWYDRIMNLNKGDFVKLNSICKAKSAKTYEKRKASFFYKQVQHSYITTMFNKKKIETFENLFELIEKEA